jgi:hypothetical protein
MLSPFPTMPITDAIDSPASLREVYSCGARVNIHVSSARVMITIATRIDNATLDAILPVMF